MKYLLSAVIGGIGFYMTKDALGEKTAIGIVLLITSAMYWADACLCSERKKQQADRERGERRCNRETADNQEDR